jgi:hypothetical protein
MAMRIDEAGHDDMPRGVDDGGVGRVDPGGDLRDFRSLEQHVADRVIADAPVHRQHRSAFDQRTAALNADALGHRARRRAMRGFKVDGGGSPHVRPARGFRGEARGGACAKFRRGDLTNLAHGCFSLVPRLPHRFSGRLSRRRTEPGSGRQFMALFAGSTSSAFAPSPQVKLSEWPSSLSRAAVSPGSSTRRTRAAVLEEAVSGSRLS